MVEDIVSQLAESGMDFKNFTEKIKELGNFVREYYGLRGIINVKNSKKTF